MSAWMHVRDDQTTVSVAGVCECVCATCNAGGCCQSPTRIRVEMVGLLAIVAAICGFLLGIALA